jgi:ABC-2 type transport system permease protein
VRDLPEALKSTFGISDTVPIGSPAGYLQGRLFALTLPLAMVVFAVGLGAAAVGGAEEDGDLELLLAQPVSRTTVIIERALAVTASIVGLGSLFGALLFALGPPFGVLDGLSVPRLLGATAGGVALAAFHGALAFGTGALTGRRSTALAVGAGAAVAGYVLQGLLAAARAPEWARLASPWHWYLRRNMLVDGVDPLAFVLPLSFAILFFAGSVVVFNRRDLR